MASSFLLSALVASKRHPVHSPTTPNCNCFVAAGCISCILRTQHLLLITLRTKHTLAPTSHLFSVRPGLYQAQTSLRHTGHPQVTAVIYGLLEQTKPTQGDMEQERGHSPIFLLRIWWHCSFYSVPLHNSQLTTLHMTINWPIASSNMWCLSAGKIIILCLNLRFLTAASTSCVPMLSCLLSTGAKKLLGMSLFPSALSFLTLWSR